MDQVSFECTDCGRVQMVDEIPRRGPICFKCHVGSVGIGFSYGREAFHGPTLREQEREIFKKAEFTGVQPEYVGSRWV
jgi:hypothetical protein